MSERNWFPTLRSQQPVPISPSDDRSGKPETPAAGWLQGLPEKTITATASPDLNGLLLSQNAPIPATSASETSPSDLSQPCCEQSESNAPPLPLSVSPSDGHSGIQALPSEIPMTMIDGEDPRHQPRLAQAHRRLWFQRLRQPTLCEKGHLNLQHYQRHPRSQ